MREGGREGEQERGRGVENEREREKREGVVEDEGKGGWQRRRRERERKEKTRHKDGMLATKGDRNTVGEMHLVKGEGKENGETGVKEREE